MILLKSLISLYHKLSTGHTSPVEREERFVQFLAGAVRFFSPGSVLYIRENACILCQAALCGFEVFSVFVLRFRLVVFPPWFPPPLCFALGFEYAEV